MLGANLEIIGLIVFLLCAAVAVQVFNTKYRNELVKAGKAAYFVKVAARETLIN